MARTKSLGSAGLLALACTVMAVRWSTPALDAASSGAARAQSAQTVPPLDADLTPLTSKNIEGHRLWIMLFDKSAMQIEDVQRAAADGVEWNAAKTANVDVVLVAVISSTGVQVLQDFTSNDAKIRRALAEFAAAPADPAATRLGVAASDLDEVSADARLGGLKTICEALKAWPQKKEMLYFTSGDLRGGAGAQDQYRDAMDTCDGAHVTIDPVDARGLSAFGGFNAAGRGAGSAGRGNGGARSARGGGTGLNALTPRSEGVPSNKPDFSGTWQCDTCAASLQNSPTALWLGQTFTATYVPSDLRTAIAFQTSRPDDLWTFSLAGSESVNHPAAPLAGNWLSTLSWDGDNLVLTLSGVIEKDGKPEPVVVTHTLSLIKATGSNGELLVGTTTAPAGVLPDGVSTYKKAG